MIICPLQNQKKKRIQTEAESLVIVSALETPPHGPGDTSLPVLHSALSEDREGG